MNTDLAKRLETERLVLRQWRMDDFDAYAVLYADPARAAFIGGPKDRISAWEKFLTVSGLWQIRGYGMYALEQKRDGAFVGMCGPFMHIDRAEPEMGWALRPEAEGKGLLREAARATHHHLFDDCGWNTITAVIDDTNARSIRLAEGLGYAREGIANDRGTPLPRWRLDSVSQRLGS